MQSYKSQEEIIADVFEFSHCWEMCGFWRIFSHWLGEFLRENAYAPYLIYLMVRCLDQVIHSEHVEKSLIGWNVEQTVNKIGN